MKTLKYKIATIIALALLIGCNEQEEDSINANENNNGIKVVELSRTRNVKVDDLGVYGLDYTGLNDFTLRNKITQYRYSDGIKEHLNSYGLAKKVSDINTFSKVHFSGLSFEKTNNMMEPTFLKEFRAKNGVGIKEKVKEIAHTMFGQEQTFYLKTNTYAIEERQYVPKLITINNVGTFDASLNRFRANKKRLSVEYNADPNNKNGVALLILWDGTTQDMSLQELAAMNMEYKNKIIVFDPKDSGVLNVPQQALSKFPQNANITLVLKRGNGKIMDIGNKKHYLVSSSEHYERIVLEE